jgi:hypothetical protein
MKKMKLIVLLALIALVAIVNSTAAKPVSVNTAPAASPAPAAAGTEVKPVGTAGGDNVYSHAEGGVQFVVPASWKVEADGEVLTLTTADGSLSVVLWVPQEGTVKEALNALDAELGKIIKNIKPSGEPEKSTLNGMTTYSVVGTGVVDGVSIEWSGHLIQARKPLIALSFAAPGAYEKHEKDVDAFVRSIKKTR